MAFPAQGGPREQLDDALTQVRQIARAIKILAQDVRSRTAAGNAQLIIILNTMNNFDQQDADLTRLAATPGLAAFAKDAYADAAFDIAAEFQAMQAALRNVVSWVATNSPVSDARWQQVVEIVNQRLVWRELTSAQTAGLRTQLDALIATIN